MSNSINELIFWMIETINKLQSIENRVTITETYIINPNDNSIQLSKLWKDNALENQVIGYDGTQIKWINMNNNNNGNELLKIWGHSIIPPFIDYIYYKFTKEEITNNVFLLEWENKNITIWMMWSFSPIKGLDINYSILNENWTSWWFV